VRERLRALLSTTVDPARLDDLVLAASELVTNAVVHGEGPIAVSVWTGPGLVRVEVCDNGVALPESVSHSWHEGETGRGLLIVDVVASRWGVSPKRPGPGKAVWFELEAASR
jgi:anti-sigma regulatory factor (Ser/Thr protein kinase)